MRRFLASTIPVEIHKLIDIDGKFFEKPILIAK